MNIYKKTSKTTTKNEGEKMNTVSWNVAKAWNTKYKKELTEEKYKDWKKQFIDNTIIYKTFSSGIKYCSSTNWALNQIEGEK
tara:strand:+ start:417 stop:662 length:246 start_codon:yes stop_codon:yes gene_type:complete